MTQIIRAPCLFHTIVVIVTIYGEAQPQKIRITLMNGRRSLFVHRGFPQLEKYTVDNVKHSDKLVLNRKWRQILVFEAKIDVNRHATCVLSPISSIVPHPNENNYLYAVFFSIFEELTTTFSLIKFEGKKYHLPNKLSSLPNITVFTGKSLLPTLHVLLQLILFEHSVLIIKNAICCMRLNHHRI